MTRLGDKRALITGSSSGNGAASLFPGSAVQQIGYATTDCKESVKRYQERYGVANFQLLPNTDLRTDIGHYVEYLYYLGQGGQELLKAIPHNG